MKIIRFLIFFVLFSNFLDAQTPTVVSFTPTGATQTFVIPACISNMTVILRGAAGEIGSSWGGGGSNATVVITPTTGVAMYLNVGAMGSGTLGGWNGGGNGGVGSSTSGGGGGGATDIRIGGNALSNRVIVMPGGGGMGGYYSYCSAYGGCGCAGMTPDCLTPYGMGGGGGMGGATAGGGSCSGGVSSGYGAGGAGGGLTSGGGVSTTAPGGYGSIGSLGQGGHGGDMYATHGGSIGGVNGAGGGGGGYYGGGGGMSGALTSSSPWPQHGGGGGGSAFINTTICSNIIDIGGMWPATGSISIEYVAMGTGVIATANTSSLCFGNNATLIAGNAITYTWLPTPDFSGSNSATISVTPWATTSYTVMANGPSGCAASSQTVVTISVVQQPTTTPSASSFTICSGMSTTLSSTGAGSYAWNPGSGSGSVFVVSPAVTTIYTLTQANSTCVSTKTLAITVHTTPTLSPAANPLSICTGMSATLSASGASTYSWLPGPGNGPVYVVSPTSTTTYTLIQANGNCSNTKTVQLIVSPAPVINPVANPATICIGGSATLSSPGGSTYNWNPGNGNTTTFVVSPTVTTTYTLLQTNFNCPATKTLQVVVNALPVVSVVASATLVCPGTPITLTGFGAQTYTWNGSLNGAVITVTPGASALYNIIGSDLNNCTATASQQINVENCTGISQSNPGERGFFVFPNPNSGEFMVQSATPLSLVIYNQMGQVIKEIKTVDHKTIVSGLAPGLYFIAAPADPKQVVQKIVVTR